MEEQEKQALLDQVYDRAYEYEGKYGSCPQAVLSAIQDFFVTVDDATIKALHGLAGGGALCGSGTCGALVGGMAAIGSAFGRERSQFGQAGGGKTKKAYHYSKELNDRFVEEFGQVSCNDVQKKKMGRSFNLWSSEEYQQFEDAGAHKDKCTDVAGKTARWTAEILLDKGVPLRQV